MPKVSVIIPAFNAERFIRETIESVLAQTFQDFEVLVIDDGSTDKTAEIVESYGSPVFCIRKSNGGASSARNVGLAKAVGEYVAFLDADDLWEPTKLEKQVALLDNNLEIGLCFATTQRIDENSNPLYLEEAQNYPDYCEGLLLNACIVTGSCSSAMVRREIIKKGGVFNSAYTNYEDWEYWLRLSLLTKFAPLKEPLVKYRMVKGSMSFNNPSIIERDLKRILDKFFSFPNLPLRYKKIKDKSYSNNWMILSGEYLHAGKYKDSLRCMFESLRLYPQNIVRPLGLPLRLTKRLLITKR